MLARKCRKSVPDLNNQKREMGNKSSHQNTTDHFSKKKKLETDGLKCLDSVL